MDDFNETNGAFDETFNEPPDENRGRREGIWLKDAIHWGDWQYDENRRVLDCFDEERRCLYYVKLSGMTKSEFIDWLAQLSEKSWMTSLRLGNFLEAIDEIISLRTMAQMQADAEGGLRSIQEINERRTFDRS
jgi:hypothetical protein